MATCEDRHTESRGAGIDPAPRVIHCPQCGGSVKAENAGDTLSCSYCGSTLHLPASASSHRLASLATIEASTVYLARIEELRRVKIQLAEKNAELRILQHPCPADKKILAQVKLPWLWKSVIAALLALFFVSSELKYEFSWVILASAIVGMVWFLVISQVGWKDDPDWRATCEKRSQPILAECRRLTQRITELEAEIEVLAGKS